MGVSDGRKLNTLAHEEHDDASYRKRIADWSDGTSVSYEDTSFVSGDSPIVLDIETDLERTGFSGFVANDGTGKILVEVSHNGSDYGGQHTLLNGEQLNLERLKISKIKLTYVSDSSYRVMVF